MNKQPETASPDYGVMLPCTPDEFGKFVSNLLGKPQTIEKFFRGVFCIGKDDVISTFHLVDQRIRQQNEAALAQFTVKVFYSDDSSVLLNSLEDFEHYSEVRPLKSVGVTLSWTYLIRFQKKNAPEKQQIDLSFRAGSSSREVIFEDGLAISRGRRWYGPGGVFLRVSHTERTWGLDIESLLSGHIKNLTSDPKTTKDFISRHSGKIGFTTASLFFVGAIAGSFVATNKFITSYSATVAKLGNGVTAKTDLLIAKVDFLLDVIAKGAWPRFILAVVGFIVVSFIFSVFFGIWVGSNADNDKQSFVLLSKAADDDRKKVLEKQQRDWLMFALSIIASIVTGIVANILFTRYFGQL